AAFPPGLSGPCAIFHLKTVSLLRWSHWKITLERSGIRRINRATFVAYSHRNIVGECKMVLTTINRISGWLDFPSGHNISLSPVILLSDVNPQLTRLISMAEQ